MRFMVMHKMTAEMEKGLPPDPATIEGVHKLIGEGLKEKVFVDGEGLKPSSQRVHIPRVQERQAARSPTAHFTRGQGARRGLRAFMRVRSKGGGDRVVRQASRR